MNEIHENDPQFAIHEKQEEVTNKLLVDIQQTDINTLDRWTKVVTELESKNMITGAQRDKIMTAIEQRKPKIKKQEENADS